MEGEIPVEGSYFAFRVNNYGFAALNRSILVAMLGGNFKGKKRMEGGREKRKGKRKEMDGEMEEGS